MDAFAEVIDAGGGVEADFEAEFGEDVGYVVAGGAFAVGAGDMDEFEAILGIAKRGAECANRIQPGT